MANDPETERNLNNALEMHKEGKSDEALAVCREVLARAPKSVDAAHLYGLILFATGDRDRGVAFLGKALDLAPDNKIIAENFGRAAVNHPTASTVSVFGNYIEKVSEDAPALFAALVPMTQGVVRALIDGKSWDVLDGFLDVLLPLLGKHFDSVLLVLSDLAAARGQEAAAARFAAYLAIHPVHPFGQRKVREGAPVALLLGASDEDFTLRQGFSVPGGHAGMCDLIVHDDVPVKMVLVTPRMKLKEARKAIEDCTLVLNAIADVDQLPKSVKRAGRFCAGLDIPVINRPEEVAHNTRDKDSRRFAAHDGIVWPRTFRLKPYKHSNKQIAAKFSVRSWRFPLIVREVGAHGGEGLEKVDDPEALIEKVRRDSSVDYFVTQWVDFRSPDGWYRKYRVYWIDGRIVPYHLYIDDSWNIHFGARDTMLKNPWMIEEERAVVMREREDLETIFAKLMKTLWQETGLDYVGCDFSILPDGRPLIFEANACMKPNVGMAAERFPANAFAGKALVEAFKELAASGAGV